MHFCWNEIAFNFLSISDRPSLTSQKHEIKIIIKKLAWFSLWRGNENIKFSFNEKNIKNSYHHSIIIRYIGTRGTITVQPYIWILEYGKIDDSSLTNWRWSKLDGAITSIGGFTGVHLNSWGMRSGIGWEMGLEMSIVSSHHVLRLCLRLQLDVILKTLIHYHDLRQA